MKRTAIILVALAMAGCTAAQVEKAQSYQDKIAGACGVAMTVAPVAGPYAVWIIGACATESAVAKLALDPSSLAWLNALVAKAKGNAVLFDGGREAWEASETHDHRVGGVIAAALALLLLGAAIANAQSVLPDPTLTPGVIASTDQAEVCGIVGSISYSKRHRATTPEMKAEVRRRYGAAWCGEIDHRLPLALGGADVVENLSCQSGPPEPWNFMVKDRLESRIWQMVCKEHTLPLSQGQAVFLAPDWRLGFCTYVGGVPCPP